MIRISRVLAGIAASLVVLTACAAAPETGPAADANLRKVVLAVPNPSAIAYFPVHVAAEQGYFAEEGLAVTVQSVEGSAGTIQALSTGRAQVASPAPGPLLVARTRGQDVVFFYNFTPNNVYSIVVPADSGITDPRGLRGKVIGVGSAEGAEKVLARNVLADVGMTEGADYKFLTVGDGGPAIAGFERGEIDAYASTIIDLAIMKERGLNLVNLTPATYRQQMSVGFATTAATIADDPGFVEGFGRAVARGFTWGAANKDRALETTAKVSPDEGSEPGLSSALFDLVVEYATPPDGGELGRSPAAGWEAWRTALVASGQLTGEVDLDAAYTNDFVDAFNKRP